MIEPEVTSDGVTVWVTYRKKVIARFGEIGMDVHSSDATRHLYHTDTPTTTWDQWLDFVGAVATYHAVEVGNAHCPDRIQPP